MGKFMALKVWQRAKDLTPYPWRVVQTMLTVLNLFFY
jgi:hypothetical protein